MRRRSAPVVLLVTMLFGLLADTVRAETCSGARSPGLGEEPMRIIETKRSEDRSASEDLWSIRDRILALEHAGRAEDARVLEDDAMTALGYRKIWLRCGFGIFVWRRDHDTPRR